MAAAFTHTKLWRLFLLILCLILGGCSLPGLSSQKTVPPTVSIISPINGESLAPGQTIFIQTLVSDDTGLARVELWIDGQLFRQDTVVDKAKSFTDQWRWTASVPGNHVIEIKAYDVEGVRNEPISVDVTVQGEATVTPEVVTATATVTAPALPTATPSVKATFISQANTNVRSGPATTFPIIGKLPNGAGADISGKSEDGKWWQIVFSGSPTGFGWVLAELGTVKDAEGIAVASAPVSTPEPPALSAPAEVTATGTATMPAATVTPTPTLTPTVETIGVKEGDSDAFYHFIDHADDAEWKNDDDKTLSFPGQLTDTKGFVLYRDAVKLENSSTYERVLETHPRNAKNGEIIGTFELKEEIENGDRFRCKVGFVYGAEDAKAKWSIGYMDSDNFVELENVTKSYDGGLETLKADLSSLAGNEPELVLIVSSSSSKAASAAEAVWINPRLEHK